ncbi:mycofactocin biosynthesis glycosyltransferase MftF [Lacisediminihabitans changchengi]|uniref:Mycofactocin biosynthesis glycosyltransferase MftF n=1 Tax=Lacisediminihabitans changchengi TaxID=2787634 RepID=A0A934SNB2_9MICO|nr:mycofactocin biosynthesis glycosyltransferase MftF [Lacisediminihabitans changchengi]MBK4348566.1 mycofactocin biosynthesis glycosyltransferase MftF [Lacisediminihabitans changchengi]
MTLPAPHLPLGFTVELNRRARLTDGGRSLIGGSPTRVLYLTETAARLIVDGRVTVTDAASRALADRLLETAIADPVLASLPTPDPAEVTYVVPVYGRPAALERLLVSIGDGSRVIIVDDVSPDRAAIVEVAERFGADLVLLEQNHGPANARNVGLRRVTTPFVAFVDSDIVLDPAATPALLAHFADPRVALAAPRVLGLRDDRGLNWIGRYEEARSSLDLGIHPATVRPRSPVSWVPGAFLVGRVDAIGDGFSAEMREGEDVDFVWRLAADGWRIRFEPAARVWHEHRQTTRDWLGRKAFYGSSAHPLALRHPHDIAPAVLAPWSVGVIAALLAGRRWSVPVALVISTVAAVRIARRLGRSEHPYRVATRLTAAGVGASITQAMALLVRHWWPVAVIASFFSTSIRRALLLSAVVDAALEYRRTRPDLDPLRFGVARRLDDLAYGTGVWWSALKGRSVLALLPDIRSKF